jgi:hypothetical protein
MFALNTMLDREEKAYPSGSLRDSRRKARALCPDGKVRACVVGLPDTFFSIPARMKANGKTVTGFVTVETLEGFSTATAEDPHVVKFVPYKYRRNAGAFGADKE